MQFNKEHIIQHYLGLSVPPHKGFSVARKRGELGNERAMFCDGIELELVVKRVPSVRMRHGRVMFSVCRELKGGVSLQTPRTVN